MSDRKYNKLSISKLIKSLFSEIHSFQKEDAFDCWKTESIYNPLSSLNIENHYRGPIVRKVDWIEFVKNRGLKRVLIDACKRDANRKTNISDKNNENENSILTIDSKNLAKYPGSPSRSEEKETNETERSKDAYIARFCCVKQIKDSIYRYACGSLYKGQRKSGKREGFGQFTLCTGDASYEGNWQNGLQHGQGTLRFCINQQPQNVEQGVFTGEWEHGLKTGTCRIKWNDRSEFHGQFDCNQMVFGTFTWHDDNNSLNRYIGLFKDFKMTHPDIITLSSKSKLSDKMEDFYETKKIL